MIALALLFITLVPLVELIYKNNSLIRAEQEITGMCILEQEVLKTRCKFSETVPVRRRTINGSEWVINSEISGSDLKTIKMIISKNNKERGRTFFLENPAK